MSGIGQFDPAQSKAGLTATRAGKSSAAAHVAATPAQPDDSPVRSQAMASATTVLQLAAQGAPVDTRLVHEIRSAIAQGQYPLDPNKIAAAMITVDLPVRG